MSPVKRAAILQDAYWYAQKAAGYEDVFDGEYSRSKALRLAIRESRKAGLLLSPKGLRIEHAAGLVVTIDTYARGMGFDARHGTLSTHYACDTTSGPAACGAGIDVRKTRQPEDVTCDRCVKTGAPHRAIESRRTLRAVHPTDGAGL